MWKKKRTEKPSFQEQMARTFELPVHVMEGLPEIELMGNREALIEHCEGVLSYQDTLVRLNTGKLLVTITGRALSLRYMNDDSIMVEGFFTGIEFSV